MIYFSQVIKQLSQPKVLKFLILLMSKCQAVNIGDILFTEILVSYFYRFIHLLISIKE